MSYLVKDSLLKEAIFSLLARSDFGGKQTTGSIKFLVCNYIIVGVAKEVDSVKSPAWSDKVLGTTRFRKILKAMEKDGFVKRVTGLSRNELYWELTRQDSEL